MKWRRPRCRWSRALRVGDGRMDAVCISVASCATAIVAEAIAWAVVFRTDEYKSLQRTLYRSFARRGVHVQSDPGKSQQFRSQLQQARTKSTMLVGAVLLLAFLILNQMYNGRVVGTLPYEPVSWVSGVTQRNLRSGEITDCSVTFIYILCSMSIRPSLQRTCGWSWRDNPGRRPAS